jgi:hypothetical protein
MSHNQMSRHEVEWFDRFREPQCDPDPRYPKGCVIDCSGSQAITCEVDLPYPAKRCGVYRIACAKCGAQLTVTTAGRSDDPTMVILPCYSLESDTSLTEPTSLTHPYYGFTVIRKYPA